MIIFVLLFIGCMAYLLCGAIVLLYGILSGRPSSRYDQPWHLTHEPYRIKK